MKNLPNKAAHTTASKQPISEFRLPSSPRMAYSFATK
jgi:hypothetical protein